ncbi:hypothetical protein GCM10015535_46630 [Streptomyces gelaticus]|uniref:Secreted protein n=1 Tax=Streptomyces gelaticus TaxID=285446 RepID=A0ABQ2W697_9ACTN|nr:hypothetical protein GCM10015535_46630 [Streptomyces gelaticus]
MANAVLAAGLILGGAGTAVAVAWHGLPSLESDGVKFRQGQYFFNPAGRNHGGFEWRGDLDDVDHKDGHNVYMQVRVEGYGWKRFDGKQKTKIHLHKTVYDGAARYTAEAFVRACRDRGSLRPDNCSPTQHYRNRK